MHTSSALAPIPAPTPAPFVSVQKRDGSLVPWEPERITRAIALAMFEAKNEGAENPHRDSPEEHYGLNQAQFLVALSISDAVVASLSGAVGAGIAPSVEEIQNAIEREVMESGNFDVAKAFILYRQRRASLRPALHLENGLADYIAISKYCRVVGGRRETWPAAVARVLGMHCEHFGARLDTNPERVSEVIADLLARGVITPEGVRDVGGFGTLRDELRDAFEMVANKQVMPSMRSMQFGGDAILREHARMFNCSFGPVCYLEFFRQYFYLLLCGTGVGFSVQKHHIAQLPPLAPRGDEIDLEVRHIDIEDSIAGWADALHELILSYVHGYKVEFSYRLIRKRGAVIKSTGKTAPGHLPLKTALVRVEGILQGAAGRHLRPIEVYDVLMHVAKSVLSGGIRRSATICLFSPDDEEMMSAKSGTWHTTNPQRSASNNSAVLLRSSTTEAQFSRLFNTAREHGEPGFYFADSTEIGANPCCEISLNPFLVVSDDKVIEKLRAYGYTGEVKIGDRLPGFQMCNLSSIAGGAATSPEMFFKLARAAALIGTMQADYTRMPYLGAVTRILNEREALIGVSICGILDNPDVLLDPQTLRRGAEVVKTTNAIVAALIGINRAARTTCVKPEGTVSLVLNSGSGIHPHHDRHYIRHVQASSNEEVFKLFAATNPHMVTTSVYDKSGATKVIMFPVRGPDKGIYREDVGAVEFLEHVLLVQQNWVMPGRAYSTYTDAHHNVSNTINVAAHEWADLGKRIYAERHLLTGISLLAIDNETYAQAPRMSLTKPEDIRLYNSLSYRPVDWTRLGEEAETAGEEARGAATACAGGACELV